MKRIPPLTTPLLFLLACGSDRPTESTISPGTDAAIAPGAETTNKTTVATVVTGDLSIELLSDSGLQVGLNPLYLRIKTAAGDPVTDAAVLFAPTMTMSGGMSHGAPVVGTPTLQSGNLFAFAVVFQMASGSMGSWSAKVGVTQNQAAPVEAVLSELSVADSGRAKSFTWTDPATGSKAKYISSLSFTSTLNVGLNPVLVSLHIMKDATTFEAVDDASLALDPQMPSMGHGAPGSVPPTAAGSGLYQGQLSLSMRGEWEATVTFQRAGLTIGSPVFTVSF